MVIQLPLQPRVWTMGQPYMPPLGPLRTKHLERSVSSGLFRRFSCRTYGDLFWRRSLSFYFLPHTTIYGTDYSLKPASALATSIESDASNYTGHISGNGVDLTLKASDINLPTMVKGTPSAKSQENIGHGPWKSLSLDLKPVGTSL